MLHGMLQSKGGVSVLFYLRGDATPCKTLPGLYPTAVITQCGRKKSKVSVAVTLWLWYFWCFMQLWLKWGASVGSIWGKVQWCYSTECTRWETLNNVGWEGVGEANPSQPVGHQEVRLPTSVGSGKVQPHSIRQIRETEAGGEKNQRVGTDESMGERVTLVWKEEPK